MRCMSLGLLAAVALAGVAHATTGGASVPLPNVKCAPPKPLCTTVNGHKVCKTPPKPPGCVSG